MYGNLNMITIEFDSRKGVAQVYCPELRLLESDKNEGVALHRLMDEILQQRATARELQL